MLRTTRAAIAALVLLAVQATSSLASTCPAPGACPVGAECMARVPSPWKYWCSYHSGAAPNPPDSTCEGQYYDDESTMTAGNDADLTAQWCATDFEVSSPWSSLTPPACDGGQDIRETRIPGDQCPSDPNTNAYCFRYQYKQNGSCAAGNPWGTYWLTNWTRDRQMTCPTGYKYSAIPGLCVKTGINLRRKDDCDAMTAHPVNALSGNKRLVETDWRDPSALGMLTVQRTYNSFSAPDAVVARWPMGLAWRHGFDLRLIDAAAGSMRTVMAYRADGHIAYFSGFVANVATRADEQLTLTLLSPAVNGVSYELRDADNTIESYDGGGKLVSVRKPTGLGITLSYDTRDRLAIVEDSFGRSLTFAYASPTSHELTSIALPDGNALQYAFSGGKLVGVTFPVAGSTTYEYHTASNPGEVLLKKVLHDGVEYTYYEYGQTVSFIDANRSRATKSRLTGAGADTNLSYTYGPMSQYSTTTLQTPLGATDTLYGVVHDGRLLLSERKQACSTCGGGGTTHSTLFTAAGLPGTTRDFRGAVVERAYDARGRETSRREAETVATGAQGCPVGSTYYGATYGSDCTAGSCWANQPFLGSRWGLRLGRPTQYYSCPTTPNVAAAAPLRITTTAWHASFNLPTERTVANASGSTESIVRWAYNARGQAAAKCEVDPTDATAVAYTCSASTAPSSGAKVRRWTYEYCESADVALPGSTCPIVGLVKSVNGPRATSDAGMGSLDDVTTYAYYASTDETGCGIVGGICHRQGDVWKVTNALGHVVENVAYDKSGRVVRTKDANGTITDMTYHARGWLLTRTVRANANGAASVDDATTTFTYSPTSNVTRVTQPDGAYLDYTYDTAHRLTDVVDNLGNRLRYTLDAAGNRTKEETYDATYNPATPGVGLKRAMSRTYNQLSRLTKTLNANLAPTRNSEAFDTGGLSDGYDTNGNNVQFADGLGIETKQAYDPLNRLTQTIQDYLGPDVATSNTTTAYTYDARDNLRTVTDPDSLATTYTYDGLGDLTDLDSPDTGHTDYAHDLAGNRTSQTDNRGVTSTYTYDALNRLIAIGYPTTSLNVTFAYDEPNAVTGCAGSFPFGKMTRMTDASGSTTYCYDRRGNVTNKTQVTAGKTLAVGYAYNKADRLMSMVYPSGAIVDYTRDAVGRVSGVNWKADALATPIAVVSSATYLPFGPLNVLTYGNGRTLTKAYDADYAIDSVASSATDGLKLDFTVDVMGNITAASDTIGAPTPTRKYVYDRLYRLSRVDDGANVMQEDYAYNKTGDRTLKQFAGQAAQVYTYLAGTHRLGSVDSVNRTYDANGNTTNRGDGVPLVYDDRNRLAQVGTGTTNSYSHTGIGERVMNLRSAPAGSNRQRYTYDESGVLLATNAYSTTDTPTDVAEHVYIDTLPIAQVTNSVLTYIEADHLGTPRVAADHATNVQQWAWSFFGSAFGEHATSGAIDVKLRYPGQMLDGETGLHYNYFRNYEAGVGRYVQSDPIGLRGGVATFAYAEGSTLTNVDMKGLQTYICKRPLGGPPGPPVPPVFNHEYVCTGNPAMCSSTTAGSGGATDNVWPGPGSPGQPTTPDTDYYDERACKKISDKDECLESCVRAEFNQPRPHYQVGPGGVDCQEYSDQVVRKCKKLCGLTANPG